MSITATSATTTTKTTASSAASLASNYETFLTLLTTQLKNQDPLDPMDTNQFTSQLVQYSGVEQQLKTNDTLASILNATQTASSDTAVGLVGKTVTASGATASLTSSGDGATWNITSPSDDVTATIQIRNADGDLVATETKTLKQGTNAFTWDGKTSDGSVASTGTYSATVTGVNSAGSGVAVSTAYSAVIDGVDFSGDEPMLLSGTLSIPLSTVVKVKTAASS